MSEMSPTRRPPSDPHRLAARQHDLYARSCSPSVSAGARSLSESHRRLRVDSTACTRSGRPALGMRSVTRPFWRAATVPLQPRLAARSSWRHPLARAAHPCRVAARRRCRAPCPPLQEPEPSRHHGVRGVPVTTFTRMLIDLADVQRRGQAGERDPPEGRVHGMFSELADTRRDGDRHGTAQPARARGRTDAALPGRRGERPAIAGLAGPTEGLRRSPTRGSAAAGT